MRRVLYLFVLSLTCVSTVAQQPTPDDLMDRAQEAWSGGDYIAALQDFQAILKGPGAERHFERIALITGELYQVTEAAPDGRALRFSPTGRQAAFEIGTRTAPLTRIIEAEPAIRTIAEVQGTSLVFSPAQQSVAYLRVRETPEIAAARKELERMLAQAAPDRQMLMDRQRRLALLEAINSGLMVRDLVSGAERQLEDGGLMKTTPAFSADGREIYFVGAREADTASNEIYAVAESGPPRPITSGPGFKINPMPVAGGKYLLYGIAPQSPFPRGSAPEQAGRPGGPAQMPRQFAALSLADGKATVFDGFSPAVSADGSTLVFRTQNAGESALQLVRLGASLEAATIKKSPELISSVALSPDGKRVVYDMVWTRNQEIFCINADGSGEIRVTREIQNDRLPRFLGDGRILAVKGESRHSRAYLYDLDTRKGTRLFHNNTLRTIAPEYEWVPNPAGTLLLIQAERDGDTISPERGVYLVDLTRKITRDALMARLAESLASERDLRARGETMFRPMAEKVREVTRQVSPRRLYEYQEALFDFDSKHISQPGNKPAGEYLFSQYKSFGYEPEYQWFQARDIRTANVLATLPGSENPDLIYVLSAHYDSNQRGPGADDNTSATAVVLETARLMARSPMPATIIFASFTGEEAGLLGSREFVRQAVEKKLQIAGALNHDMIGWANDFRLDNTIRYSNSGIRDLQHAAAFLFSKMITYDARYFKSTDAAAYYDAYGDIVGGFGSYPVLGSPYYHQPTDLLENVNQQLMVEATKANIASIMLLASSPSRVKGLKADVLAGGAVNVSWARSPEKGIVSYTVAYGSGSSPMARTLTVKEPGARIGGLKIAKGESLHVAVRAVNGRGLAGWDWARTTVTPLP